MRITINIKKSNIYTRECMCVYTHTHIKREVWVTIIMKLSKQFQHIYLNHSVRNVNTKMHGMKTYTVSHRKKMNVPSKLPG